MGASSTKPAIKGRRPIRHVNLLIPDESYDQLIEAQQRRIAAGAYISVTALAREAFERGLPQL